MGPISASLRNAYVGNTASFEETSQGLRVVGNTVSDLTGLSFEPQTSRCRDECVSVRPSGWFTFDSGIYGCTFSYGLVGI